MMFIFIINGALAGTATDAPGKNQADFSILSETIFENDTLYETESTVGNRDYFRENIHLKAEWGIIDQVSVGLTIPYSIEEITFSNSSQMEFDPILKSGTYIGSDALDDFSRSGNSFTGAWMGVSFYPFHQRFYPNRGDKGSWKIGAGYRFGTSNAFFTTNDAGDRGAGEGSGAFTFHGAFSTKSRFGEPYLVTNISIANRWTGDIRNENGETLKKNAELRAASQVQSKVGNEIPVWEDNAFGSYVSMDFYGKVSYESWRDTPTGLYLPSILDSYEDMIVTQGERLMLGAGLGVNMQFNSYYALRLSADAAQSTPQYIEHPYNIKTLGTFNWSFIAEFCFRYRTSAS